MKKLLLTVVCAIGCSSLFADSYLYWMINDSPSIYKPGATTDLKDYSVRVIGNSASGTKYLNLYYAPGGTQFNNPDDGTVIASAAQGFGLYASVAGLDYSSSILVELLYGGEFAGVADLGRVDSLSGYIASFSDMDTPVLDPKEISSFSVPEPTSGLLMLLGVAGLALRRRKMQKA